MDRIKDSKFVRDLLNTFPGLAEGDGIGPGTAIELVRWVKENAPKLQEPLPEREMVLAVGEPENVSVTRYVDGKFNRLEIPHHKLQCPDCNSTDMVYESQVIEQNTVRGIDLETRTVCIDHEEYMDDECGEDRFVCGDCGKGYVCTDDYMVETRGA